MFRNREPRRQIGGQGAIQPIKRSNMPLTMAQSKRLQCDIRVIVCAVPDSRKIIQKRGFIHLDPLPSMGAHRKPAAFHAGPVEPGAGISFTPRREVRMRNDAVR